MATGWRSLVDASVSGAHPREKEKATPLASPSVSVFLTPQSLVTFPIASMVVSIVWKVLANVFPAWGGSKVTLLVIALVVGTLIYLISSGGKGTVRERAIGIFIAIFNSFFLAATAMGIDLVT